MCGIVGYVGKNNAKDILINGLKALEYRGYDSSGIALTQENKINIIKSEGKVSRLEDKLTNDIYSNVGIGHTRWATHGIPNEINAHPENFTPWFKILMKSKGKLMDDILNGKIKYEGFDGKIKNFIENKF